MMNSEIYTESGRETVPLRAALKAGAARLFGAAVDSPVLAAEVLLRHVLGLGQEEFSIRLNELLSLREQNQFRTLLERRAAGEPVAYITGKKEFWSLDFMVTPAVLIPRPETELLVELALDYARDFGGRRRIRILDIGTGSGAVAVSLAKHLAQAEIWAVDISYAALRIAEANANKHHVRERIHFLGGDLCDGLHERRAVFDLILSNPPYVRRRDIAGLAREIRDWEPRAALDGGDDGLEYYRRIIRKAPGHLELDGRILLEIGCDMAESVVDIFARAGCYTPADTRRDYAGLNRVVAATKGNGRG